MEIGVCCGIEYLDAIEQMGYDRIELTFTAIAELDEDGFRRLKETLAGRKIQLKSTNCMFPGTLTPLYLDDGLAAARQYLSTAMPRLKALGITTAVFGSGAYRSFPEEWTAQQRHARLLALLELLEEEARKNGLAVAIEPLNQKETSTLCTTTQALAYLKALNSPHLGLVVDLYHFCSAGQTLEQIYECAPYIRHVHIAEPENRDFLRPEDRYDYRAFFAVLRDVGYTGAVMFEGGKGDYLPGVAQTYPLLRALAGAKEDSVK